MEIIKEGWIIWIVGWGNYCKLIFGLSFKEYVGICWMSKWIRRILGRGKIMYREK